MSACPRCHAPKDSAPSIPYCRACWNAYQLARRHARLATGGCRYCVAPREPGSATFCDRHRSRHRGLNRIAQRRKRGHRPYVISGIGRPPLDPDPPESPVWFGPWRYLLCGHLASAYPAGHDVRECTERTNRFLEEVLA